MSTSVITHEFALETFGNQLQYALDQYKSHGFKAGQFENIVIGGLGGSGIGGRIAKAYFNSKGTLPIEVYSDYSLPAYVSSKSFVVLSSYSGSTEETLSMYEQAKQKGATIVCISSGGEISDWARRDGFPLFTVSEGYQPRMALGFSLCYNWLIISDLYNSFAGPEIQKALSVYSLHTEHKQTAARWLSPFDGQETNKFVIVADSSMEAVGTRFCQQIQENAKAEAFINVLPEANHNVFETYYEKLPNNFIFLNSQTNPRNNGRFAYLKAILEKLDHKILELDMKSGSIEEILRIIYITDWFSILLSNKLGRNNMSVPNISGLKEFLKSF